MIVAAGAVVAAAVRVVAGAGVRVRMATRTARLPSGVAEAGVKLTLLPRRAKAAASRGSETAGVKAAIERPFIDTAEREMPFSRWEEEAMAGASNSERAVSDVPPATAMALNLFTDRLPVGTYT